MDNPSESVTVTVSGVTTEYPTALAAAVAILDLLPTASLGGERWGMIIRRLKQRRTEGLPGPQGEAGSNVVLSVK